MKALAGEQREAERRALRIGLERRARDRDERDRLALADGDRVLGLVQLLAGVLPHARLDAVDDPLRLVVAAVDEQPARALGHVAAHEQDADPEQRPDRERQPPADVAGEEVGVEQEERADGAERRAQPVGAVDDQVHPPAHARGDQLVDGGVDRRVLAADAGPR